MATFKDKHGKDWVISLDAPLIMAVRRECDLDLASTDGSAYERMADDPILLVNVLWVLCREQAGDMTDVMFGKLLVGDAIEKATEAMLEAICDFFPLRKRQLLQAVVAKNAKIREIGMEKALARINDPQLLATLEARMDAEINSMLTRLTNATN